MCQGLFNKIKAKPGLIRFYENNLYHVIMKKKILIVVLNIQRSMLQTMNISMHIILIVNQNGW